ncbi:MAG: chemotaxis protein CheD [Gemmatimonadaceae bacterium]
MTAPPTLASSGRRAPEVSVGVAQCAALRDSGSLVSYGLGSCVAIILYDATTRTAGIAHVLLPDASYSRDQSKPGKFPHTAVPQLVAEMRRLGAGGGKSGRLTARLVGGASMFGSLLTLAGVNLGERNVGAARAALAAAGIAIVGEDVGGDFGRSVAIDVADGRVTVQSMREGTRGL